MKNRKDFLRGAFCGALAILLVAGLVSCGLLESRIKTPGKEAVSSGTEKKLDILKSLIDDAYLGHVDEKQLEQGIYEWYVIGLDDPYSAYYEE